MRNRLKTRGLKCIFLITSVILVCAIAGLLQGQTWIVRGSSFVVHRSTTNNEQLTNLSYRQGDLLVRFVNGNIQTLASSAGAQFSGPRTTSTIRSSIANSIVSGSVVVKEYDRGVPGLSLVRLPARMSVLDAVVRFNQSPYVLYAQPNYKIRAMAIPNDPMFFQQWGLNNTGQNGGLPDADIDAPEAWDITTGSSDMIVAVLDSGIDVNHPDLVDNMWINDGEVNEPGIVDPEVDFNDVDDDGNGYNDDIWGYDFVDDDFNPADENFHGTHVAGIIGAVGNNTTGIAGVCWQVKLMALRVLDPNGEGVASDAIEAINYAVSWRVNVMNASWGYYEYDQALYDAIEAAGEAGILFVAAAGNDGLGAAAYPAGFDLDNIISVMATDRFDNMAVFSNYGLEDVDLGAPGVEILSTTPTTQTTWMENNGIPAEYAIGSGTSAAAAHVTGACVLMKVVNSNLTYLQIKQVILRAVDPTLPDLCVSGGRLNLYKALHMALKGVVLNTRTARRYSTIQDAIDGSLNGDTLVADSDFWYIETIDFKGKAITVRSGDVDVARTFGVPSRQNTFISALFYGGSVVTFSKGETLTSVLQGFTIVDGAEGIYIQNSLPYIKDCNVAFNSNSGVYCDNSSPVIINTFIIANKTEGNGGGIFCDNNSDPNISNCKILGNTSAGGGGGIYCGNRSEPKINGSEISRNAAQGNGGGIYSGENCDPNIFRSVISSNAAQWYGGGIYTIGCSPLISDSTIVGNTTAWDGGGIYLDTGSHPSIMSSTINGNVADYDGGGIYCNGTSIPIINCLIINNSVDSWDGGGVFCLDASPTITNCTFTGNSANNFDGLGGAVYCSGASTPRITNCIFSDNNDYAIHEQDRNSEPVISFCIFNNNPRGDYYDRDTDRPYDFRLVNPDGVLTGGNNFSADPMFVRGRLGNYYLSQYEAGQILDINRQFVDPNVNPQHATSPAVDAGSDSAAALGLNRYSTRTDNYKDADGNKDLGRVDIGYHYNDLQPAVQYTLHTAVVPAGRGTVSPDPAVPHSYKQYSQVPLIVSPKDPNTYRFKSWEGTDDDTRIDRTSTGKIAPIQRNVLTMDSNKDVTVRFETILVTLRARVVGGNGTVNPRSGAYLRDAAVELTAIPVNPANRVKWNGTDDDFSTLRKNVVSMSEPFVIDPQGREFKEIEVIFYSPRVINVPGDFTNIELAIDSASDGDIIVLAPSDVPYSTVHGYTITQAITIASTNPDDPNVVARTVIQMRPPGPQGGVGQCFYFYDCNPDTVLDGITITGFNLVGGTGQNGNPPQGYYDGVPGGDVIGAAIRCDYASPTIRNCVITDCSATGGNGGDGANGDDNRLDGGHGGWPGAGYGGGLACLYNSNPIVTNCTFQDCIAAGGNGGNGGNGNDTPGGYGGRGGGWYYVNPPPTPYEFGPFGNYTGYSGHGGATYCDGSSFPVFTSCTFTNNRSRGGTCGISGITPINYRDEPSINWEIDNFGGAVYIGVYPDFGFNSLNRNLLGSQVKFINCRFNDNVAEPNVQPDRDDLYVSYGGAVAFSRSMMPLFEKCTFNNNFGTVGGAIYGEYGYSVIDECSFAANSGYNGGGVYLIGGTSEIRESRFSENDANGLLGAGGGLYCFDIKATIFDCNIIDNNANNSGGGIFVGGSEKITVENSLIIGNSAGRDGGGISANWHSESKVVNCTITNNMVAGHGFGGGLYCSYNSLVNIVNSIFWNNWGNLGAEGSQLAVATGFKYDPRPSTINVTYSDIQGSMDPNAFGAKTEALDLVFCIDTTGSMFDDIDAVKNAARQITGTIATKMPDYRIAVVEYKDFNQPNLDTTITDRYGGENDYPYRTVVRFTTDTNAVVAGLNSLTASGGADMPESVYTAVMHCIDHNSLAVALAGQLYGADPASRGPGAWRPRNVTRVIILMGDAPPHDPEPFTNYTLEDIADAAGGTEPKCIVPVLIGQDPAAAVYFTGLANETGGAVLLAATAEEVVPALMAAIDLITRIPNPISVGADCRLNWSHNTYIWDPNSHNIDEDPLFIAGYYLSQAAAGQPVNSPAVNAGNNLASVLNMSTYTTRTDSVPDSSIVDMGYHYKPFTVPQYRLNFTAVGVNVIEPDIYNPGYNGLYNWYTTVRLAIDSNSYDSSRYQVLWTGTDDDSLTGPNNTVIMNSDKTVTARLVQTKYDLTIEVSGGNGRLSARWLEDGVTRTIQANQTYSVRIATVVQLMAEPDEGYRVRRWSGTDNDSSRVPSNTVTMNDNRTVRVQFGPPITLAVPRDYATIQDAIYAAQTGDTIVIHPGAYFGPRIDLSKPVTIMSEYPDDPCCVAGTVIDRTGYAGRAFNINSGADGTILNGLTIQNCSWTVADSLAGSRAANHPDGYDGGAAEGAALYIAAGVDCTVKNCVFINNQITGGNGGNAENATDTLNAGRGGWAGWARGGAIFCGPDSNVEFINCRIVDNQATGGSGGNGGNYQAGGGAANYGGNWSLAGGIHYDPNSLSTVTVQGDLWQRWGYIGNYRFYSGYGGGVYCGGNSVINFDACTISGNVTFGGMSGIGGDSGDVGPQPDISYEIPSYGGGVYCAAGSTVIFNSCRVTDNNSSSLSAVDPNGQQRYRIDPYIGHGGGVCAENTASVVFTNSTFGENQASLGGGMFWANANPVLSDCNVVDNVALSGGGIYLNRGTGEIIQSDFSRNDANGPVGDGGAIYCLDANVLIVDCTVQHNNANSNGGGVYFAGNNTASIANCLITNNMAGRSGGGVSVNWFARPVISNCTFVSNFASGTNGRAGTTGFGGGLYCGYESDCEVFDSIFWNNYALVGKEIIVGTISDFERRPSTLAVSYSDIMGGRSGVRVDRGCTLRWLAGNIDADPLFVTGLRGDYYLSQTAAGQPRNSPCVDAGSNLAGNLGMARLSTRTDEEPDKGVVDIGYHFSTAIEPCSFCNFFNRTANGQPDGIIDFKDFALFASHWLQAGCSDRNDWCNGADLTNDSNVDRKDLEFFVRCWLAQDTNGPVPNPGTWEVVPYLASPTSIRMVAKESFDGWGWDVQYYFERLPSGEPNSGWQSSREWVDGGLDLGVSYGYRVKARDELGNESEWSVASYAGTEDVTPPAPAPYILPIQDINDITPTSISLMSSIAYDESGVEYLFRNVTISGHDSNWVAEPNFVDLGLKPNTTYGYQVKARDRSARRNETLWSEIVYVPTLVAPDTNAPVPNPMQFDPNGMPSELNGGGGTFDYYATMTAVVATDNSGGVEYYFECFEKPGISPGGWQTANTYTVAIGRSGQGLRFRVKARDIYNNETDWSPLARVPPAR